MRNDDRLPMGGIGPRNFQRVKRAPKQPRSTATRCAVKVTQNQRDILIRLFAGAREREIAVDTGRRPSTIFNTVRLVREQLGARTDYDLMRECIRLRIVTLSEVYKTAHARQISQCGETRPERPVDVCEPRLASR